MTDAGRNRPRRPGDEHHNGWLRPGMGAGIDKTLRRVELAVTQGAS